MPDGSRAYVAVAGENNVAVIDLKTLETTGRIASLMGAFKIAVRGTQNHSFTKGEFAAAYAAAFGTPPVHMKIRAAS